MSRIKLNIEHLQALVTLADTGTVTQAAERLHITQPSFSYRLREAERRTGVTLFSRVKRRLQLTSAGRRLLYSARAILTELAAAEADIVRFGGVRQRVRLGSRAYSSFRWLPGFLRV